MRCADVLKVKNIFVSRGAVNTGRAMWRVISKFDYDNSGAIDVFEFQKGMKEFGLELTKDEIYMIMDQFDKVCLACIKHYCAIVIPIWLDGRGARYSSLIGCVWP